MYFQEETLYVCLSPPIVWSFDSVQDCLPESERILVRAAAALFNPVKTQLCPLPFAVLLHFVIFFLGELEGWFSAGSHSSSRERLWNPSCCPAGRRTRGRSDLGAELIPEFWQHHVERWWFCVCLLLLRTQKQLGHF